MDGQPNCIACFHDTGYTQGMKVNCMVQSRCFRFLEAAQVLGLSLSLSWLAFSPARTLAADLPVDGRIIIDPTTSGPVVLELRGVAADSAENYGLSLSYHDSGSTTTPSFGIFKLYRPMGEFDWYFSTDAFGDRPA